MNLYGKRVLKAAIFFLGLLLLLVLASHLFMPKDNTREAGIEEFYANGILAEKKNTIDILISGDSFSYSSLVPSELWKTHGYTSYENGTNDQHLDYTMILLRRAFENQSPKLVILEPSLILHEVSSLNALIEHVEPFLPVFHDHDRWKSLTWKDFYKKPEYTQVMNYKGYQYFTKIKPASDSEAHNMVPTDDVAPIPASCLKYIRRIQNYCEAHGAKLVFLSAPNALSWDYAQHNAIAALAKELDIDYLDANLHNDQIGIDWSHDTCDHGDHLNHAGAVKNTRFLEKYLDSLGILTDHRGDPEYADWDRCLKVYEKKAAKEDI